MKVKFAGKIDRPPGALGTIAEMASTLFYGDNLDTLRKLKEQSIDLCYIDPPFNSKRNYNQIYNNIGQEDRAQAQAFVDTWEWGDLAIRGLRELLENADGRYHPKTIELMKGLRLVLGEGSLLAYLVSLTLRIAEIRRVLKLTGTFYLHCDPEASHYLKLICDSIFCSFGGDFRNEIIWKRTNAHNSARHYGPVHDVLLYYSKSDIGTHHPLFVDYNEKYKKKFGKIDEITGKPFQDVTLTGSGVRSGESGRPWRGHDPTAKSRHWAIAAAVYESYTETTGDDLKQYPLLERLDRIEKAGLMYKPQRSRGGLPRYKFFLADGEGVPLQDVWTDVEPVNSQAAERLGYPTQKPEALLERIIKTGSAEGEVVLDAYCGCGTTIAVAQRLKREWIGMDITYQSVALVLKRIEEHFGEKAIDAIKIDGVPRDMESAAALAHKKDDRVRKEFEKWAVLTYTSNRGVINEKKGADAGIDGTVYFMTSPSDNAKMVLQVKSGAVSRGDVAKLHGDMQREQAAMATLITLEDPTDAMLKEARSAGLYDHALMARQYDKIQIVTVREIIEGNRRLDLPLSWDVLKKAEVASEDQLGLKFASSKPPPKPPAKAQNRRKERSAS